MRVTVGVAVGKLECHEPAHAHTAEYPGIDIEGVEDGGTVVRQVVDIVRSINMPWLNTTGGPSPCSMAYVLSVSGRAV